MAETAMQTCSKCRHRYELPPLPTPSQRMFEQKLAHVPFSTYVYAVCPSCGHRDWAEGRKYLAFAGPRTLYAMGLGVGICIVILVVYLGFFFKL